MYISAAPVYMQKHGVVTLNISLEWHIYFLSSVSIWCHSVGDDCDCHSLGDCSWWPSRSLFGNHLTWHEWHKLFLYLYIYSVPLTAVAEGVFCKQPRHIGYHCMALLVHLCEWHETSLIFSKNQVPFVTTGSACCHGMVFDWVSQVVSLFIKNRLISIRIRCQLLHFLRRRDAHRTKHV